MAAASHLLDEVRRRREERRRAMSAVSLAAAEEANRKYGPWVRDMLQLPEGTDMVSLFGYWGPGVFTSTLEGHLHDGDSSVSIVPERGRTATQNVDVFPLALTDPNDVEPAAALAEVAEPRVSWWRRVFGGGRR